MEPTFGLENHGCGLMCCPSLYMYLYVCTAKHTKSIYNTYKVTGYVLHLYPKEDKEKGNVKTSTKMTKKSLIIGAVGDRIPCTMGIGNIYMYIAKCTSLVVVSILTGALLTVVSVT